MKHVAPHRWADALAGRVSDAERGEMEAHADGCDRCRRARHRVQRASDSFQQIRAQTSPEVAWDEVRARVHWSVSTERRAKVRAPQRPRVQYLVGGGLVAGAIALAVLTGPVGRMLPRERDVPVAAQTTPRDRTPTPPVAPAAAPLIGIVNRATGDVMIDGVLARDVFARALRAGTKLATGTGSVDVQFAAETGFVLGPRSVLELRQLDARTVELVVEGTIDVEVAPRANGQRFLVQAGERTIEVRGTQFRIQHDRSATVVACRHGQVAVRDAQGLVEVSSARRVAVPAGAAVQSAPIATLTPDELADLADAAPLTLAAWGSLDLLAGSAPLELTTVGRRDIRVDGVELGRAPMRVRVLPGRHTVEVADAAGRYRRAGWVDVSANGKPARLDIPADPLPTRGVELRRRQLQSGIDKGRLARCTRAIAKSGLTDTYVQISISVDERGALGFLNVIDTDLPSATATCVRDALAEIRFPAGAAATWRERIAL